MTWAFYDDRTGWELARALAAQGQAAEALETAHSATQADPDVALLDMIVLVTLKRMGAERLWLPENSMLRCCSGVCSWISVHHWQSSFKASPPSPAFARMHKKS